MQLLPFKIMIIIVLWNILELQYANNVIPFNYLESSIHISNSINQIETNLIKLSYQYY